MEFVCTGLDIGGSSSADTDVELEGKAASCDER